MSDIGRCIFRDNICERLSFFTSGEKDLGGDVILVDRNE